MRIDPYSFEVLDPDSEYESISEFRCSNYTCGINTYKWFQVVKKYTKTRDDFTNFSVAFRHSKPRNSDPDSNLVENAVPDSHEKEGIRNHSYFLPLSES